MWVDKNEEKETQTPSNTAVGAGAGGSAPVSGSNTSQGNPSTISSTAPAQPTQQFATIQDYLGNNKQQGEDLGQKVTSSLDTAQTQDKGNIDQAANATKNDINNNTINYDGSLVNRAQTDPTSVANNSNDLNSFLKQWNATYSGPSSFETSNNYGSAASAASDANTKAQELNDVGGREQLIGDQFGVYGQGNKGLDQALLQSSSYFPKVQDQQKGFNSIQDYLKNTSTDVNNAALGAKATTDATKTATQAPFANALTNFQTGINNEVTAAQTPAQAQADQLAADFKSGDPAKVIADIKQVDPNIDAQTLQSYLTAMNAQTGTPTDLSKFYSFNPNTAITTANAATADDYARAAALQKLTGVDYSGVLNQANASQAGTAPSASSGITSSNINDYLKNQYDQAVLGNTALNKATPATPGVPGISDKPAAGASFQSQAGIPGISSISIPDNATPETVKSLASVFNTPLSQAGNYHEGAVYDMASRVNQLRGLVSNGQITQDQYNKYVQPIQQAVNNWGSGATGQALSVYNKAKQDFNNAIK